MNNVQLFQDLNKIFSTTWHAHTYKLVRMHTDILAYLYHANVH